jgi:sporulation protein YlmC with PRC-barrel domain
MRLSELLGAELMDQHGRTVGKVHDVRLQRANASTDAIDAGYQLAGLIVGRRAMGVRFGFGRGGARGPWLLKMLFGRAGHDGRYVPWDRVAAIEPGRIRIFGAAHDLPRPQPSADA